MRAKPHPKFIKNTLIKRFDFKLHFCCDILRFFQFLSILMPRTCVLDLDQHGTERARYELQNFTKPLLLFCFGCASRYAACLYSFTFCFPSLFFCFAYYCFVQCRFCSFLLFFVFFAASHVLRNFITFLFLFVSFRFSSPRCFLFRFVSFRLSLFLFASPKKIPKRSQNGAKMKPKWSQKAPKDTQNGAKMHPKTDLSAKVDFGWPKGCQN